ncbi:MAG: carboxypeptidase M32 [Anaerolineae bacterium]|nr:carboxypeptidase M32 [Anaerolineae bacterium]
MSAEMKMTELKARLLEISDLNGAASVLGWDQSTYMPPGGGPARSRQSALLGKLAHERFTAPELGRLLDELESYRESLPYDHDDAALLRVTRRTYDQRVRIPAQFMGELLEHIGNLFDTWTRARPANDFGMVRDGLAKTLDYSRRFAEYFPHQHVADPLIDLSDYGMTAESVRAVFDELRAELVPLVQAITAQPPADNSFLRRYFPQETQLAFGVAAIKDFGYDFNRGRQDLTHHPFMTRFSAGDIRITTRVDEHFLTDALFSTLHEAGHALYEQGIDVNYDGLPLGGGTSAGVHESQSRTWENIVGRSRAFWAHYYPRLQAAFPEQLGDVSLDSFYRAVNKVERSLIRVDADEVTYNLHVMIRFGLELDLLEGKLSIDDLPEAWRARYTSDLGITPPDDKDGVLQDVHWYGGLIGGAFQGYTIGNLMSAQFYEAALRAHPEIEAEIGQGKFDTLRTWATENIYRWGSKFTANELMERVTGGPLQVAPLIRYLRGKYGELYSV